MIEKSEYFKTFCKIGHAFGTTIEKEKLLNLIVDSAVETMDLKAACLWLADEETGRFHVAAQKGLSEKYFQAWLGSDKIFSTLGEDGYLYAEDATIDPRLEDHEGKKAEGIASMLIVPVHVRDRMIGVLSLYTGEKRAFSEDEIEFLKALADQGGVAVLNNRLVERIRKYSTLFLDLASKINSSLDIREILRSLSEETCKTLGMKGVVIRLYNEDTGNLDLVASYGMSDEYLNKGPVSAERSVAEAFKGKTVVIENVASDDRLQYKEATLKEEIRSMVCAPIRSREQVIGVMRLCSEKARKYPEEFLTLVNALAHTGALAIQNASMYLTLQKDKQNLEEDGWLARTYF